MRTLQLGKIAAEAELLRLRQVARRTSFRLVNAACAIVFLGVGLATALVAVVVFLADRIGLVYALWTVAGVCLLISAVLVLLAAGSKPGAIEVDAKTVRDSAISGMKQASSGTALATEVAKKFLPFITMWLFRRR